ncbi:cytochrome P450 [Amycolatopsis sp. NPDC051372]|uniref:cytochrome P450 n=1 Tax=unclassified Amycolatopsis TaxID=2618356 RepID=UPI0034258031
MHDGDPADCAVTDIDPFSDEFLTDPFPALAELRDLGEVFYLRRYGVWGVARHEQVTSVLRQPTDFSNAAGVGYSDLLREDPWRSPSLILEVDPPIHTTNRRVLARILSPRALRDLTERFAREAELLVDRVLTGDVAEVDAVQDLVRPFVLKVFPDSLGLPADGRENLLPYGGVSFNALGPRNARFTAAMRDAERLAGWVERACSRRGLGASGFGPDIFRAADEGTITEADAGLLVRSFLTAGVDTTVSALGFALLRFAQHPDQWDRLRAQPSLARAAFDEVVRVDSPVIAFFRTTTADTELAGTTIPGERKVMVFFAGANRDPSRWTDPDDFDITRNAAGHAGFGAGIHNCAGQMVARLEAEALLQALARRVQRWDLAGTPAPSLNNALRALGSLPLRAHRSTGRAPTSTSRTA